MNHTPLKPCHSQFLVSSKQMVLGFIILSMQELHHLIPVNNQNFISRILTLNNNSPLLTYKHFQYLISQMEPPPILMTRLH